jgi:hypothetical protein
MSDWNNPVQRPQRSGPVVRDRWDPLMLTVAFWVGLVALYIVTVWVVSAA